MTQAVVEVCWTEGSVPRSEVFDFGEVEADDRHHRLMVDFFASLRANGIDIQRAVISLVQDPLAWLAAYERDHHVEERK